MFRANALTLHLVFLVFAVGGRIALHYLATGDHGIRTVKPSASRIAKSASFLLLTSFIATFVLSFLDAIGTVQPQVQIGGSANTIGASISLAGIALMVVSQYQMGVSWRFGVDQDEKTDLVMRGLYSLARNPIYSGVFLFYIGLLVLLPHILMLLFITMTCLSIEMQVRFVEEPHLRDLHGAAYEKYAEQTGRYFPKITRKSRR